MGFGFKKSKKFGGVKLNLSKSGVGFSAGVKGFRVSAGSKGVMLNAGKNGIYYRKKLDGQTSEESEKQIEEYKQENSAKSEPKGNKFKPYFEEQTCRFDWVNNFDNYFLSPFSYCYKVLGKPYNELPKDLILPNMIPWFTCAVIILLFQKVVGILALCLCFYILKKIKDSEKAKANILFKEAFDLYRDNKFEQAIEKYNKILEIFPNNQVKEMITACYLQNKDYENALSQIEKYSYYQSEKMQEIEIAFYLKEYSKVIQKINNLKTNEDVQFITLLALAYYKSNDTKTAFEILLKGPTRKRTNIDLFHAQFFYFLGFIYEQNGEKEKALKQYEKVALYSKKFSDIRKKLDPKGKFEQKEITENFKLNYEVYFVSCSQYRKKDGEIEKGKCLLFLNDEHFWFEQNQETIYNNIKSIYYFDIWEYKEKIYCKFCMRSFPEYIFGVTNSEASEIANFLKNNEIKIEDNR